MITFASKACIEEKQKMKSDFRNKFKTICENLKLLPNSANHSSNKDSDKRSS
ncbi:hypothetical protein Hanom_Chr00s000008g01616201 [Helianthus anomalus]